jgi:transposase-like protein
VNSGEKPEAHGVTTVRRNREFWERAVREVERGAAVSAVARRLAVRPGTLSWWRWHLRNDRETRETAQRRPRVAKAEFLPVVVAQPMPAGRARSPSAAKTRAEYLSPRRRPVLWTMAAMRARKVKRVNSPIRTLAVLVTATSSALALWLLFLPSLEVRQPVALALGAVLGAALARRLGSMPFMIIASLVLIAAVAAWLRDGMLTPPLDILPWAGLGAWISAELRLSLKPEGGSTVNPEGPASQHRDKGAGFVLALEILLLGVIVVALLRR